VISELLTHVLNRQHTTSRPVRIILKHLKHVMHKKPVGAFLYDMIDDALKTLDVDWADEDELLLLVIDCIPVLVPKDPRASVRVQSHSFNRLMEIFCGVVAKKGITEAILRFFDVETLNLISVLGRKSNFFSKLSAAVNELRPTLFQRLSNGNPAIRGMLSQMVPASPAQSPRKRDGIGREPVLSHFRLLVFTTNPDIKTAILNAFHRLLDRPNPNTVVLIALATQVATMEDHIRRGDEDSCDLFITILHELSSAVPSVISHELPGVVESLKIVGDRNRWRRLFEVAQNLIIFDPSITASLSGDGLSQLFASDIATPASFALLKLFPREANRSRLASACIEHYFTAEFDENCETLLTLLATGLEIAEVAIPAKASDLSAVQFATALWALVGTQRGMLSNYLLSAMRHATPIALFRSAETISRAYEVLDGYCPERLQEVLA
jgi:hypothetical protein